jgi:hypothetical protein
VRGRARRDERGPCPYTDPAGNSVPTRHFSTLGSGGMEYKGCGQLDSQAAHASDLAALEELALRFGVPSYEGKLGDIFTLPDTMHQAVLQRP